MRKWIFVVLVILLLSGCASRRMEVNVNYDVFDRDIVGNIHIVMED